MPVRNWGKDIGKNTSNLPESEPLDSALNKIIVITKAVIFPTRYTNKEGEKQDGVYLETDLGAFRSTAVSVVRSAKDEIIPALDEGDTVRAKVLKQTFKSGNRGLVLAPPDE